MMMEVSRPPEYASTTFSGMNSPWFLEPGVKTMDAAAEEHQQNGFLNMQAILGLIEDHGPRRVDYVISNFFAAMRRQTMHEQRVRCCRGEQLLVDLISTENLLALRGFALLSHAGPHIRVNCIRSSDGLLDVGKDLNSRAGSRGDRLRLLNDFQIWAVAFRRGYTNRAAEACRGEQQGMRDVVSVADVSKLDVMQIAELFLQGLIVGQCLAGMLEFTECVDDGNAGVLGHAGDGRVRERTQNDAIDPALEVVRDITQALTRINAGGGLIDEERVSAEAGDPGFEGQASAQRGLLKEHHDLLAGEGSTKVLGTRLDQRREIEDGRDAGRAEIVDGDEVLTPGLHDR